MPVPTTFPKAVLQNGRNFFFRHQIEDHKRALAGLPPVEPPAVLELVPAAQVAAEYGFGRRTLGRLMEAAKKVETHGADQAVA
jgi:hypothetical protein